METPRMERKPVKPMVPGLGLWASAGVELAAAVGGCAAIGYWIDRHWENEQPWGLVICSVVGIIGGLYNLIRKALLEAVGSSRRPGGDPPAARKSEEDHHGQDGAGQ